MRKNLDNILMALLVAIFIIAALGLILNVKIMTLIAMVALTLVAGVFAGVQVKGFLSADTVSEEKDTVKNRQLLIQTIVSVVLTLALLAATIFALAGKLF